MSAQNTGKKSGSIHYRERFIREFLLRLRRFYKTYGLGTTIRRSITLAFNRDPYKRVVAQHSGQGNEIIFSKIYELNLWSTTESRSGRGSTREYTKALRQQLPLILAEFAVKSFVDAPCGDFNWMRDVELPANLSYVGIDIVADMIARNQAAYGSERRKFVKADITRDSLPKADIIFCRDCLFHLSLEDIFAFLQNFVNSQSSYLMTSTHQNEDNFPNCDIKSGGFRVIDLFREPFCLTRSVLARVEDYMPPDPKREMCIWPREAIVDALTRRERNYLTRGSFDSHAPSPVSSPL
jgi:hypothetical protein